MRNIGWLGDTSVADIAAVLMVLLPLTGGASLLDDGISADRTMGLVVNDSSAAHKSMNDSNHEDEEQEATDSASDDGNKSIDRD